jgi:signal transduction histidine kinase
MIIDNPYNECIVLTDQNRVSQILHNFISNALKHTSNGFIKIGYSYEEKGLMIYVEDSGRGIPDDKKNLIFNRFEKLDDFSQGTGLGLSISKAIIDSIGGKIGFESEVGKGSTFWAWIPCEKEN